MTAQVTSDDQILDLLRAVVRQVLRGNHDPAEPGADRLTLDMDIDDVGLDSVMAMEVVGCLEQQLGREFPDDRLARMKTFRDLAKLIREG